MSKSRAKVRLKVTKWLLTEPVGVEAKGFLRFALSEAQKAKEWTWAYLEEHGLQEGEPAWIASQLRRRYLAGKPLLHTVPGSIFEQAILHAVKTFSEEDKERYEGWDGIFLPLREGWTGERGAVEAGAPRIQKFSFTGEPAVVIRGSADARVVTPEKAEDTLFQHGELVWKWGVIRLKSDVEAAVTSAFGSWHMTWRGPDRFFESVKGIEVRRVEATATKPLSWQLRFHFK